MRIARYSIFLATLAALPSAARADHHHRHHASSSATTTTSKSTHHHSHRHHGKKDAPDETEPAATSTPPAAPSSAPNTPTEKAPTASTPSTGTKPAAAATPSVAPAPLVTPAPLPVARPAPVAVPVPAPAPPLPVAGTLGQPPTTAPAGAPATMSVTSTATSLTPIVEVVVSRPAESPRIGALLLGVRGGAVFPQLFNKLGTSFIVDVEVAVQLPVAGRRFGLFLDGSYCQPSIDGITQSPQLPGSVTSHLIQRDAGVALGAQIIQPVGERLLFIAGLAAKLHFTTSSADSHAGMSDLGYASESSTRLGALARLGLGIRVGPGAVVVEAHYEYTPVDQLLTGSDNSSHIAAELGYVLHLL